MHLHFWPIKISRRRPKGSVEAGSTLSLSNFVKEFFLVIFPEEGYHGCGNNVRMLIVYIFLRSSKH